MLTGAGGFIGGALRLRLAQAGHELRAVGRRAAPGVAGLGDMGDVDWGGHLRGVDTLINAAGLAHGRPGDLERVNHSAAVHLARQAAACGVRRFVQLSTIKVHGERSPAGRPFTEADSPAPADEYARSKWAAERSLAALDGDMEVLVLRLPLVYGARAPANFGRLLGAAHGSVPLPCSQSARRSMLALANLVDFVVRVLGADGGPGGTFLLSDDDDMSTEQILQTLAAAMGKSARPLRVPPPLAAALCAVPVLGGAMARLLTELRCDPAAARARFGWTPPLGARQALAQAARDYAGVGDG